MRRAKSGEALFVYDEPKATQRYVMWDLLRRIKSLSTGPWFLVSDFNEAMWQSEHFSRHKRSLCLMVNFREVLSGCNVFDPGLSSTRDMRPTGRGKEKS